MSDLNTDEGQANSTLQQNGPEASPGATGKTITISGKSFNVSDDIAQALTEQSQSVDRRFDERAAELGELRGFRNTTLQREQDALDATQAQEAPNLSNLMYDDPDKFVGTIEDKIAASEEKMRQEYQQVKTTENAETAFWNSMWAENKDLARVKPQATDIISMISQKYAKQYPDLKDSKEVRTAFAEEARTWMKGLVNTGNGNDDPDNFVEGSSTQSVGKITKAEPENRDGHTKRILTGRREAKRAAKLNPGLK